MSTEAPVKIIKPDGSVTGYGLGSTTDAARGTAFLDAVGDLVSGEALVLGPGTFDVGNSDIGALPSQISMCGKGMNRTKISSAWNGNNAVLRPAADSYFADFWVEGRLTDGTKQTAFGWRLSGPSVTGVVVTGVRMTADGYAMQVASSQAGQYRLFGCELIAKFVGFHSNQFPPVMDLEAYECLFAARGPHNFPETYNAGFLNDNGQAKLFNCRFEAVNGPTNSVGVWQQGPSSTANSFTELYGCVVKSEGAPNLNLDLVRGDPTRGPMFVDAGTRYDASKTGVQPITRLLGPFGIGQSVQSSTVNLFVTINFTTYSYHVLTIQANVQISLSSLVSGMSRQVVLEIVQDGIGGRVPTWDGTNIRFPSGAPPTLSTGAGDVDVLEFFWNGTKFTFMNISRDVQ